MVKYICESCKYETDKKTDYSRHNKSKRHLEKVEEMPIHTQSIPKVYLDKNKVYNCIFCENIYSNSSALSRHKKACELKDKLLKEKHELISEKEKETNIVNIKTEHMAEKMELLEKEIKQLHKQVNTYETMLKAMSTPQTINNFNYICNNYPDTPALEGQKSYTNMIESKKLTLMDIISMYYYDKKLVPFLGDYIIRLYKKEEPKNQSLWTTDISRLTYIISESCKKKGNIWTYDKKGSRIKKVIIEPILTHIRENLVKFCQEHGGTVESHILKYLIAANGTIELIDSGELANDITRYIAPEFAVKQIDGLNESSQSV